MPENMLLQEISRNYIHIQHQALNFLWFTKKWVVDVVAPTIFPTPCLILILLTDQKDDDLFKKDDRLFLKRGRVLVQT